MTSLKTREVLEMSMDLKKLDPMARKMRTHVDAFYKALEDSNAMDARSHINEITKYAEYLSNDVEQAIMKAEESPATKGVNDIFAGGVPVLKFQSVQRTHPHTNDALPGTIRTNRIGNVMRPLSNRTL